MLNIYKASAGSGKTHKLIGEYLKLLFSTYNSTKFGYKTILAVTFTNKATGEMKQRILEELYTLSQEGSKSHYLKDLDGLVPSVSIQKVAGSLLIDILNDYSMFNVSTIDRFFQQTLRSFAREVGKYTSYNVELDQESVLIEAIDALMNSLEEDGEALEWLVKLSVDSIESGGGWNVRPNLKKLADELFSENFKIKERGVKAQFSDRNFLIQYRQKLSEIVKIFENLSVQLGRRGILMINKYNLQLSDFYGGSRSPFIRLSKMAGGDFSTPSQSFFNLEGNIDKWVAKKADEQVREKIEGLYSDGLNELISDIVRLYSDTTSYHSAKVILENLYILGILYDIQFYINDYCKRKNIVLLSESTQFLNKIIDGSDNPFIYERIGGRIDHYMLDEFQDTSLLQWLNFKPLVKDSLDSGNENLIVGDVKQSIYRWRGSDWNLLNNEIYRDFDPSQIDSDTLLYNRRSSKSIVEFNNTFFSQVGKVMENIYLNESGRTDTLISDIYSSVHQIIPEEKMGFEGHVKVEFVKSEDDDEGWKDVSKRKMLDVIKTLKSNGYKGGDIAVLVRLNREGQEVASTLIEGGYNVISEDSLYISSSKCVERVVSALKYSQDDQNKINAYLFKDQIIDFNGKSLFDFCDEFLRVIVTDTYGEEPFINAFMDCVLEYTSLNGSDIPGFISWWDQSGRKKTISLPDGEDAIRIITIHKSKGLGFNVVIMPFFKETIGFGSRNIIWCNPSVPPFNELSLVPVKLLKSVKNTIFADDYFDELLYSYVDAINTSYVAFTRAKRELFIFSEFPKRNKDGEYNLKNISDLLYNCFSHKIDEEGVVEFGNWAVIDSGNIETKGNKLYTNIPYLPIPIADRLRLRLNGYDFFEEESMRVKGILMHNIFSCVTHSSDLRRVVNDFIGKGIVKSADSDEIYNTIAGMIASVEDKHWFDGTYQIFNERVILTPTGFEYRPDRVMIKGDEVVILDYKFGKNNSSAYLSQVSNYVSIIKSMGYGKVSGFLWFTDDLHQVC